MAKVLLAKPVGPLQYYDLEAPDLGLGYLATALKKEGHEIKIVDCIERGLTQDQLLKIVAKEKPDFFGFKIYTKDLNSVIESYRRVKQINPDIVTLAGGPFPSGAGPDALKMLHQVDYAFQGEAELGLPKFVSGMVQDGNKPPRSLLKNITGLVWRDSEEGDIKANDKQVVEDLDSLGYPDWEALEMKNFIAKNPPALIMKGNYLPIITGRGCPFKCTYCAGPAVTGNVTRHHSIPYMMNWLRYFIDTYGANHFSITDDNFLHERAFVRAFSKGIIDAGLKIHWEAGSNGIRLNQTDEETLQLMEQSGCYLVSVGIESGSARIIKAMKRSITLPHIIKSTWLIRKSTKIRINGFFIMGYPEETWEDLKATLKLALELPLDRADFFVYTPHPGTESYGTHYGPHVLTPTSIENFRYDSVSGVHPHLSARKLRLFRTYALLRFFLRPRLILDILMSLTSFVKVKRFIEFFRFAFFLKPRFKPRVAGLARSDEAPSTEGA